MNVRPLLLVLILVSGLACSGGSGESLTACTTDAVAGVVVSVTRSDTSAAISGAKLILTEAAYSEQLAENPAVAGLYYGAIERKGIYTLTVSADGFAAKRIEQVRVAQGECHVVPARLDLALDPVLSSRLIVIDASEREWIATDTVPAGEAVAK